MAQKTLFGFFQQKKKGGSSTPRTSKSANAALRSGYFVKVMYGPSILSSWSMVGDYDTH